jgi:cell division protein FtsQ
MRRVKPAAKNLEGAKRLLLKRRIVRWLPRRPTRVFGAVLGLGALVFLGLGAADQLDHGSRLSGALLATTGAAGLKVQALDVEGRQMTTPAEILAAVNANIGAPILGVSPAAAKLQLEALPWVRSAAVERQLPNRIYVKLVERKPLALWQRHGKMVLIDQDGVVVATENLERYANLLLVVGDDAPKHAESLIEILGTQPDLMKKVQAAVWINDRRWNLKLDSGIDIELPEDGVADAWTHLAAIDRDHGLLARDIERVDLRLADRVVVKVAQEPVKTTPAKATPPKPAKPAAKKT